MNFSVEPIHKIKVLAFYASPQLQKVIIKIALFLTVFSSLSYFLVTLWRDAYYIQVGEFFLLLFSAWFFSFICMPFYNKIFVIPLFSWSFGNLGARYIAIFLESVAYLILFLALVLTIIIPWGIVH
jgi:hypothetical protein